MQVPEWLFASSDSEVGRRANSFIRFNCDGRGLEVLISSNIIEISRLTQLFTMITQDDNIISIRVMLKSQNKKNVIVVYSTHFVLYQQIETIFKDSKIEKLEVLCTFLSFAGITTQICKAFRSRSYRKLYFWILLFHYNFDIVYMKYFKGGLRLFLDLDFYAKRKCSGTTFNCHVNMEVGALKSSYNEEINCQAWVSL